MRLLMYRVILFWALFVMSSASYSETLKSQQLYGMKLNSRQLNIKLFEEVKKGRMVEVIVLLEEGARLEAVDRTGNTALLLAALALSTKF